jgi:hypothetical protein
MTPSVTALCDTVDGALHAKARCSCMFIPCRWRLTVTQHDDPARIDAPLNKNKARFRAADCAGST